MDWPTIIGSVITNAIFITIAAAVVNHILSKKLDDYRYGQLQRQKAEVVAQLLAKWGKYRGGEGAILKSDAELYDYYEEFKPVILPSYSVA
jgi:hypothetical protein